jgi:formamidopyrimidine-DNA glycosylase
MPELPEVETVARDLRRAGVEGRRIAAATVLWPRIVTGLSPREFAGRVRTRRIVAIGRRGKYLVFGLSGGLTLLVHLRMTGRLVLAATGAARGPHDHLVLRLDDGRDLRFHDSRKFGRWVLTAAPERILGRLGPEPLDAGFTSAEFADRLARHHRQLKPLLLDQAFIAGGGNIYADEALWEARLHPQRLSNTLSRSEAGELHRAVRQVLRRGIAHRGTSLGAGRVNFHSVGGRRGGNQSGLKVFRRTGGPCPRCGTAIRRLVVGQRSTHICTECQTR